MTEGQDTADYYRFCPGEERVKISTAICQGRRRTHYPKCRGCQFNDDEQASAAPNLDEGGRPAPDEPEVAARHHHGLRPRATTIESLFQPSDISGAVPVPLSEDAAWRIGHATGQFLRAKLSGYDRVDPNARSIIVGRDSRKHSQPLESALIEGVRSAGSDVISLGLIDAGHLYFAVNYLGACGGIHVSAGPKPADHNGFRICGTKASPVGVDTGLASIRDIAIRVPRHQTNANTRLITKDFSKAYTEYIRDFMVNKVRLPRVVKVVVDASNGAAGRWLPIVLKGMRNLRMTRLNFDHQGEFTHEPNPLRLKYTRELRRFVKEQEADFGVCFDSSAERAVFTDDKGRTVRPEFITALLAREFIEREPGATVVYDHRFSIAAEEEIVRAGGIPVRERIGGAFIKRSMAEREAVFGADLSGRFYFRDGFYCESGLLAFVHVLNLVSTTPRRLSEVIRPLQRYSTSGEIRFQCENTEHALNQVAETHRDAAIEQLDGLTIRYPDWWFNIRPLAAERLLRLTVEARSRKLVDEKLSELQPLLGERV